MTCALLGRPNKFLLSALFCVRFVQKKIDESNDIIFKMILLYNFINKFVFKYLRKIDHFFTITTIH